MKIVTNKLLITGEIDAIVFTAYKGHDIVRELLSHKGVYIIDAEQFPYAEYPYYEEYKIEEGTYRQENRKENSASQSKSGGDKNAYTFATLAILISSEEVFCSESFILLRHYLNEIQATPSDNKDWHSLIRNPGYGVNAGACVE